jgi:hypothetical protein
MEIQFNPRCKDLPFLSLFRWTKTQITVLTGIEVPLHGQQVRSDLDLGQMNRHLSSNARKMAKNEL